MLFKGILATQMSGAIGGVVASHNAGGTYFRARVTPTNPNSPQQIVVRNAVAFLSNFWNNGLTPLQRGIWNTYAENVKVTNRIGDQIFISGMAQYVRSNVGRVQANLARADDGPGIFNIGQFSATRIANFSEATQLGEILFGNTVLADPWANEVGGFLFVFISRPQNESINYFRGPYRLVAAIVGDPVPPVSPILINAPFPFIAGAKIFGRAITIRADGRLATPVFMEVFAVA